MRVPIVSALLALLATGSLAGQDAAWMTSYEKALAQAKKEKKVILADFTGSDWCGWCIKLKDEVFTKPEFQKWAGENVVLLELDFPKKKKLGEELAKQNAELKERFKIRGYPTIVFIDAEGKELGRSGYRPGGPEAWIADAETKIKPKEEQADGGDGMAADAEAPTAGAWMTSWSDALAKAKKTKKPLLVNFTGSDWCSWCVRLKDEVFSKPEFQKWAEKNVVLVEIDFPRNKAQSAEIKAQNAKLQEEYKIQGYPTVLVIDASGKKRGQLGYQPGGPEAWIETAEKALKKAR